MVFQFVGVKWSANGAFFQKMERLAHSILPFYASLSHLLDFCKAAWYKHLRTFAGVAQWQSS